MNGLIIESEIKRCIYTLRGQEVMLDEDLARLYGVELKRLNEQVLNMVVDVICLMPLQNKASICSQLF
jgi:hypothetical protein